MWQGPSFSRAFRFGAGLVQVDEFVSVEQRAGEGGETVLADQLFSAGPFRGGDGAAEGEQEGLFDLAAEGAATETAGKGGGHVGGEAVVEKAEGLEGRGGDDAARFREGRVRTVEDAEEFGADAAGRFGVDGAAIGFRTEFIQGEVGGDVIDGVFIEAEAGAAGLGVEEAADVEHGIAEGFGLEALGREAPEEAGFGIDAGS